MGNKYVLILVIFTIWMVFFDTNSWFIHKELNDEIDKLEGNRAYFKQEIKSDRDQINKLKDSEELERFAREEYYICLLYTSPSPRDQRGSRMPSSA